MTKAAILRSIAAQRIVRHGWSMSYDASRPVTGAWRAERHGVGMCAGDHLALERMIDAKHAEEEQQRRDNPLWAPNI